MSTPQQLLRRVFPPMLATLADAPPSGGDWSYELKYDGFRAVGAIAGGSLALWSRNELDLAPRFPRAAEALKKIKAKELVVDGEIVVLDEKGRPRFQLLQQGSGKEKLYLFDILWLDGRDLRNETYLERRKILEKLKVPAGIEIAERMAMTGEQALALAKKQGWEGIIAKRDDSVYETRRSKAWLKVKALNEQELVIIGWHPSTHSNKEIGSLHLAVNENGELRYAGKVGTGFSAKMRVQLLNELQKDVIPNAPAKGTPRLRDATWVKPRLVAQVSFTEWTGDNRLRHPSFLGLREDKSVGEVVKEKPIKVKKAAAPAKTTATKSAPATTKVNLTHPERVLYPRDGITKQHLADYYEAVAEPLLHALADRPLTLEHWNQGIDAPSWFHQNIGREGAKWLTIIDTPTRTASRKTVKHLVADSRDALRWLAQMSVLTIHMWSSRGESLESPDWVLFDLDPAKGKGIEQAIEAAGVMRKLLDNLELPSVPKTSGKRGIHVFVPLENRYTHEQAAEFACTIAAGVAKQVPTITVERSLGSRKGRLYLDCIQNGYGKTVVAPYSPRAIDGAPVSAPLKWSEITKKLDPLKFNIKTMPNRLAKVGDLFAEVFTNRTRLPQLK